MAAAAAAVMVETACLGGVGSSRGVSRSFGTTCGPSRLRRASSAMPQLGSRNAPRIGKQLCRADFVSNKETSLFTARVSKRAVAGYPSEVPEKPHDTYTVGDFMTRADDLHCALPTTTVDEALEILVAKRITGLPVVDDEGILVGVVSDYDLLALDSISGKRGKPKDAEGSLFPEANSSWKAFREIRSLLGKTHGKTIGELMSPAPIVVGETTNIEDAARILLETKFRRLPVVGDRGKLVGLLTRGNVVGAALAMKRLNKTNVS